MPTPPSCPRPSRPDGAPGRAVPAAPRLDAPGPAAVERWQVACPVSRLGTRPLLPVRVGSRDLLLVRDGDALHAVDRACPHEQADLALGRCGDGRLHCPRHRASFDLTDGTISPGWSSRPLRSYPVRITDGTVQVALPDDAASRRPG